MKERRPTGSNVAQRRHSGSTVSLPNQRRLSGSKASQSLPLHYQHSQQQQHPHQHHYKQQIWFLKWTALLLVIGQALVYIRTMTSIAMSATGTSIPCHVVMNGNGNTYFGNAHAPIYLYNNNGIDNNVVNPIAHRLQSFAAADAAVASAQVADINAPKTSFADNHHHHHHHHDEAESVSLFLYEDYTEQVATINHRNITFRFSTRKFAEFEANDAEQVIVGVLSHSRNVRERQLVRELWAHDHGNVFFMVGNNWTQAMRHEFAQHGDLIWMDMRETYRRVVYKTLTLFTAFGNNLKNYRHLLKTDDDSYVRLGAIEALSAGEHRTRPYWGQCKSGSVVVRTEGHKWYVSPKDYANETYPRYAMGGGYALSQDFVHCAVEQAKTTPAIPIEDAHTGILAAKCGVKSCLLDLSIQSAATNTYSRNNDKIPREFSIKWNTQPHGMIGFHHMTCADEKYARHEKSCADRILVNNNNESDNNNNNRRVAFPLLFQQTVRDYTAEHTERELQKKQLQ